MFGVEHDGKTYAVSFTRQSRPKVGNQLWSKAYSTTCRIDGDFPDLPKFRLGYAHLHRLDRPNQNIGCKLAMARALKNAGFNKPTRTKFWEAYFQKRHGKKT